MWFIFYSQEMTKMWVAANSQADSVWQHCMATLKITEQKKPEGKEDFRHFHQPAWRQELVLQGGLIRCAHFPFPKHSGKIHNSLKQNLCSCITAATSLKRRTHFLPFFWKPLVPCFVLLISAEGGFIMQTPWGWLHSTELMSPDWMPENGRRVKI